MLTSALLPVLGLMLSLAVPGDVLVQASVDGFAPKHGADGTLVEISGSGFHTKRPRVWLVDTTTGKALRQKVRAWSDEAITIELRGRKLVAGQYAISVCPCVPGAEPALSEDTLQVMPPVISRYAPTWIADEREVSLEGDYFGSRRRPKVRVGDKPAKVLAWSEGKARVRVRKSVQGDLDVSVSTPAGTTLGPCPLYVHGASCALDDGPLAPGQSCPLQDVSWIYLEIDGFAQWGDSTKLSVAFSQVTPVPPALPQLKVVAKDLLDPSGANATLWLTFQLQPGDDNTPIDSAQLLEARYVSFHGPTDTRVWKLAPGSNQPPVEWAQKHCFSFAHLGVDLAAQGPYGPSLLHLASILRVDTMALMGD